MYVGKMSGKRWRKKTEMHLFDFFGLLKMEVGELNSEQPSTMAS